MRRRSKTLAPTREIAFDVGPSKVRADRHAIGYQAQRTSPDSPGASAPNSSTVADRLEYRNRIIRWAPIS
jgi:hypothetical protein